MDGYGNTLAHIGITHASLLQEHPTVSLVLLEVIFRSQAEGDQGDIEGFI